MNVNGKRMLQILGKHVRILVVLPLLTAIFVAAIFHFLVAPDYMAETVLYTLHTYQDNTGQLRVDTNASASMAADFRELINVQEVMSTTAFYAGFEDAKALQKAVRIQSHVSPGTHVFKLMVSGKDAALCANVANSLASVFAEYVENIHPAHGVEIVSRASVPVHPSGPPIVAYTALSYVGTLLLLLCGLALREAMNTNIVTDAQIKTELKAPLLASLPDYRRELSKGKRTGRKTIAVNKQYTKESFRKLATRILYMVPEHCALSVTSTSEREGKTSVAVLLGKTLAAEGKRVLIVDMDWQKPQAHTLIGRKGRYDLMDLLCEKARLREVVQKTDQENLWFVDARRREEPVARVVASSAFDRWLRSMRADYDVLLFDTAPLGYFVDAALLSAKLDGTLFIVGQDMVQAAKAREAIAHLRQYKARVLGVAMNYTRVRVKAYRSNTRAANGKTAGVSHG